MEQRNEAWSGLKGKLFHGGHFTPEDDTADSSKSGWSAVEKAWRGQHM